MTRLPIILISIVLILGVVSTQQTQAVFYSSEVEFTDTSRGGFAIVPASCSSAPPPSSGDGGGYTVPNGTRRAEISRHGYIYCVTNYTGNTIFIPANTASELSTFFSVAPGIGGMEVVQQSAYPAYCHYTNPDWSWYQSAFGGC